MAVIKRGGRKSGRMVHARAAVHPHLIPFLCGCLFVIWRSEHVNRRMGTSRRAAHCHFLANGQPPRPHVRCVFPPRCRSVQECARACRRGLAVQTRNSGVVVRGREHHWCSRMLRRDWWMKQESFHCTREESYYNHTSLVSRLTRCNYVGTDDELTTYKRDTGREDCAIPPPPSACGWRDLGNKFVCWSGSTSTSPHCQRQLPAGHSDPNLPPSDCRCHPRVLTGPVYEAPVSYSLLPPYGTARTRK